MPLIKRPQKDKYDIISISHYFPPRIGGLENMAYNLLKGMADRGLSTAALFGSDRSFIKKSKNFKQISLKVTSIFNNTYPLFGVTFVRKLVKLLHQNPNAKVLIHSRHLTSSVLASLICRFIKHPYTLIEHNGGPVYFNSPLTTAIANWVDRNFFNSVIENAEDIIAVSETGKKWISSYFGISKHRISVVYNAFSLSGRRYLPGKKENLVVFASKWIKVKDPDTTLKAYLQIAEKYPSWTFMLIGEGGTLESRTDTMPKNLVILDKLLKQEDLFDLLAKAKIYVNSSLSEGLALGILEAVALGCVPVVSNASSNREIAKVLHSEEFVFKRQHPKDLARSLERAIKISNAKRFAGDLVERVFKNFSVETMVQTYHQKLLPRHFSKPTSLSIVIPVYNEEALVGQLLKKVADLELPGKLHKEIIIVNDGSSDNSKLVIENFLKEGRASGEDNTYLFLENPRNSGKSVTVKNGILASTGDLVVTQDADLEYKPSDLRKFVNLFLKDRHLDVIYGNRFNSGNSFANGIHSWGNRFVTRLSNAFTRARGFAPKDMETCYKMVRGDIMRTLFRTIESETSFGLEPELTAKLARYRFPNGKKLQFSEIDISYKPRDFSTGKKMRWFKNGFEALLEIIYFNVHGYTVSEKVHGMTVKRRL